MTKRKAILSGKDQAAVSLGSRGGKARAKKLTPERRREIAVQAVKARWAKRGKGKVADGEGL